MNAASCLTMLAFVSLTTAGQAQIMARRPSSASPTPSPTLSAPLFSGSTGSPTADAAAAFAAGDLVRAEILYRTAYQIGDRGPATLAARAQLALWQNKWIEAENLARAIDAQAPEAQIGAEVLATVASRRNDELAEAYRRAPGVTGTAAMLKRDPLPFLVAMINGRAAGLIVDTGSDQLMISDSFARLLGISATPAAKGPTGSKIKNEGPQGMIDHVNIGNLRVSMVPATILPAQRFATFKPATDGILGLRFLARFRATIDYPRWQIVLAPRNAPRQSTDAAVLVPLWLIGDHELYVEGAIGNAEPQMWRIDTGLAGTGVRVWDRAILERAGVLPTQVTPPKRSRRGLTNKAVAVTLPEMHLGQAQAFGIPAELTAPPASGDNRPFKVGGVLSHEFFKRWVLTFELDKMQLILETPKTPL